MNGIIISAFLIGFVAGLRAFTAPAAVMLLRGGVLSIVFAVGAVLEYVVDALPQAPARVRFPSIAVRPLSGAFCGWMLARITDSPALIPIVLGVIGAFAGTYAGYAARMWSIKRIGAIPAALAEDVVAIALALLAIRLVG